MRATCRPRCAHPAKAGADNPFAAALTDADLSIQTLVEVVVLGTFPSCASTGKKRRPRIIPPIFAPGLGPPGTTCSCSIPLMAHGFTSMGTPIITSLSVLPMPTTMPRCSPSSPVRRPTPMRSGGGGLYRLAGAAFHGSSALRLAPPRPVVYVSGTLGHLVAPLRQHFQVVYLPTDYSPTVLVPNHTGILDGSLTGSVLAEAP